MVTKITRKFFEDKALELDLAVEMMFYGMMNRSFTSKKLRNYFNAVKGDWGNARRIIRGLDKGNLNADCGRQHYSGTNTGSEPF